MHSKNSFNNKVNQIRSSKGSTRSAKKLSVISLNIKNPVGVVSNLIFPWTVSGSYNEKSGTWPYILQSKFVPPSVSGAFEEIPAVGIQTKKDVIKKLVTQVSEEEKEASFYEFKLPKEKVSSLSVQHSLSRTNSTIEDDPEFKHEKIVRELQQIPSVSRSRDYMLPNFVNDESPYVDNPIPETIETHLPSNINLKSIMKLGRPWHKIDRCTWAKDLHNLSMEPDSGRPLPEKSVSFDWGVSVSTLQKNIYDKEYKRKELKKRYSRMLLKPNLTTLIEKFIKEAAERLPFKEPTATFRERRQSKERRMRESGEIRRKSITTTNALLLLSYSPKDDRKLIPKKPRIDSIDNAWNYLIKRKWRDRVVHSTYFKTLRKTSTVSKKNLLKSIPPGKWPYAPNMIKEKVEFSHDELNRDIQSICSKQKFSKHSFTSEQRRAERLRSIQLNKSTSTIICSQNRAEESQVYVYKQKLPTRNEPIQQFQSTLPYSNINQGIFGGFVTNQAVCIDPQKQEPAFIYKLSNLKYHQMKYTHLLEKQQFYRIAFYYSVPYFTREDPFVKPQSDTYKNGNVFINVPDNGKYASINYPNGQEAIQCAYRFIKNNNDYPVRRYTIYDISSKNKNQQVLAIFDTLGNGIVYNKKGTIRLNYSQNFGSLFETLHGKPLRWRWHNIPVKDQHLSCRTDSIEDLSLPKTEVDEMRSRNINLYNEYIKTLAMKQKDSVTTNIITDTKTEHTFINDRVNYGFYTILNPFKLKINKYMLLVVKDQKHIQLIFNASNKKIIIQLGIIIQPDKTLRTEIIHERDILKQYVPCQFDTIVGNTISLLEILKNVNSGKKVDTLLNPPNKLIQQFGNVNLLDIKDATLDTQQVKTSVHQFTGQAVDQRQHARFQQLRSTENIIVPPKMLNKWELGHSPADCVLNGSKPIMTDLLNLIHNRGVLHEYIHGLKHKSHSLFKTF